MPCRSSFELLDKGSHSRTEKARSRRYAARILVLLSDYLWGKHHGIRLHSDLSSSAVRLVKGWNFRDCSAIRSPFTSTMLRDIRSCGPIFMTSSFHTLKSPRLVRLPCDVIARRPFCQNTSRSAPVIMTSAAACYGLNKNQQRLNLPPQLCMVPSPLELPWLHPHLET